MSQIAGLAEPQFVAEQYRNAENLDTRIQLHQRFSTNRYGWHRWVFDQFRFPAQSRILELGCGTGELWLENLDRIPAGWDVTLSDSSAGMVEQARQNLGHRCHLRFEAIDAQRIPFEDQSLDGVIANHMLYHVPDRNQALSEVRRVLRPDGTLYASTVGEKHLQEIAGLLARFDPQLTRWGARQSDSFVLENGGAQLAGWFEEVRIDRYEDALLVTELAPLVDYVLSGTVKLDAEQRREFVRFAGEELQRLGGKLRITKDSGIFAARRPLRP